MKSIQEGHNFVINIVGRRATRAVTHRDVAAGPTCETKAPGGAGSNPPRTPVTQNHHCWQGVNLAFA